MKRSTEVHSAEPQPESGQGWTAIAIGLVFFVVLQAGAIVVFVIFIFDARYTCDRARDSCEVEHVGLFSRQLIEQFRPSLLVNASAERGRKGSWIALQMANGAPEIRIGGRLREERDEVAARLRDFIADRAQLRFHHVVETYVRHYVLLGVLQSIALILLYAIAFEMIQKLRRP